MITFESEKRARVMSTPATDFFDSDVPGLSSLMAQAASMSVEEFAASHPGHYLITEAVLQDDASWRSFKTSAVAAVKPGQQRAALAVAPVVKRDQTNPYSWMITIGRTRNNDIVLSDVSISKLHAWIRRRTEDDGTEVFTVTDAGSRNGTFVNANPLRGDTGRLPVGARLRLGQVELLFADGRMLHEALRRPGAGRATEA